MKALVYGGPGKKALEERPKPKVQDASDAVVKLAETTICGADLHVLKGDVHTCAPGRQRPGQPEDPGSARTSDLEWDLVDETSFESFPASDPPGWISHRRTTESVRISIRPGRSP